MQYKFLLAHFLGTNLMHFVDISNYIDNFKCECGQVYANKRNLKRHMANAHKGQKSFSCPFCPAEFCKRFQIVKHLTNIHAAKKPFICGIQECHSSYRTKRSMQVHQRNVHGNTTE